MSERHTELSELQDTVTATRRDQLVGSLIEVLVDRPGVGRSHREAPEIDGVVKVPQALQAAGIYNVLVTRSDGLDVEAELVEIDQ
jgi:ribosomal protein S12 methylthiotransferase